jgi:hypothetical protein
MPDNQPTIIGWENYRKIGDRDRAQEVWDRAMTPEAKEHIERYMAFKAGHAPDPGPYRGPVVDFDKAIRDLDYEHPEPREADNERTPL